MKKIDSGKSEKITAGDVFHRVLLFALCGLIVLGVYFIVMFQFFMFDRQLWEQGDGESGGSIMGILWYVIYSAAYIIPLFFVYFIRNNEYKRVILQLTEGEFRLPDVLKKFTLSVGKYDFFVYAGYSLLLLLPFKDVFDNPAIFISIQEVFFYMIPVPKVVSYILAILSFAVQYYICLAVAAHYWDKHRLRLTK